MTKADLDIAAEYSLFSDIARRLSIKATSQLSVPHNVQAELRALRKFTR
jgi:hypothetical protein